MKKIILITLIVLLPLSAAIAQSSPDDPAIIKAKEETAVVFDLGRLFGYINTMEAEEKKLTLNNDQMEAIYKIMSTLKQTDRIEPDMADQMITDMENNILTVDQLMYTDQLAIAKMATRTAGSGSGGGGGQITNYIAGGAFNPMTDPEKNIGKDFDILFNYLIKKLGK
ncbi:MAG: hypothetical protein J7L71_05965 [Spirochaetaceae bacterium]|nr:hypothetical protein [Spirochaetaceae bacterium]